jgi:DMSO/TMAO reductase YedYZ molybdopterin-dependent catalytic subunit
MEELKKFPQYSRQHVLECAGNGRHGYRGFGDGKNAPGNQWTIGPAGNANWTGVLLKDVLASVGVTEDAKFVAWMTDDAACPSPSAPKPKPGGLISRGVPIEKAMDGYVQPRNFQSHAVFAAEEKRSRRNTPQPFAAHRGLTARTYRCNAAPSSRYTMLAFELNGEPIPSYHGFPLRFVAPGFPGAAWGKWVNRLWVRNQTHDGPKMAAPAYRVPIEPVAAGSHDATDPNWTNSNMKIIEQMPVRALITAPLRCITDHPSRTIQLEGRAWSGAGDVAKVELSFDHGQSWKAVEALAKPANKWAWQHWAGQVTVPTDGVWQVHARATDVSGVMQPMFAPYW